MIKQCQQCNKEFETFPSNIKRGKGKFCSKNCHSESMRGIMRSEKTIQKMRQARLKNPMKYWLGKKRPDISILFKKINTGKKFTEKHIQNLSTSHKGIPSTSTTKFKKGHVPFIKGKKGIFFHTEEHKEKMRKLHINHPNRKFKDTNIELKMEKLLKRLEVDYQKQVPLFNIARVDFYISNKNLVIQCDGCYYHGCSIHYPNFHQDKQERDMRQDEVLERNGLKVIRFWEHEIMSPNFNILNLVN